MRVTTHLTFRGECETAFTFYAGLFGGSIDSMLRYNETPLVKHTPTEWQDRIVHATLNLGGGFALAGVDIEPHLYRAPEGIRVLLAIDSVEEAERIFNALAEGGKVEMPLQKTFWSRAFAMLTDRFGIPWEVHCA